VLPAVVERLFPFHRGLLHAYWAPNAYALYAAADKALNILLHGQHGSASLTGGLVGSASLAILPTPTSATSLLLTIAAMVPALAYIARRHRPVAFLDASAYVFLTAFMFGYHVHEKAILNVTVLSVAGALRSKTTAAEYVVLSTAGHVGLMPLLFTAAEYPIKLLLVAGHTLGSFVLLSRRVHSRLVLLYLSGLS
jgi:alpha-1,3-glucosyltransferase